MHANRNKSALRRIEKGMMRANRTRNAFAVLAIILTTFMITTIFTIGVNYVENMNLSTMRTAGTAANAFLNNPTPEQVEKARTLDYAEAVGERITVGAVTQQDDSGRDLQISLLYADRTEWEKHLLPAYKDFTGSYPDAEDEILLSRDALEQLGIPFPAIGMEIPLTYADGNGAQQRTFSLSGWFRSYTGEGTAYVSDALRAHAGCTLEGSGLLSVTLKNTPEDFFRLEEEVAADENAGQSWASSFSLTGGDTVYLAAVLVLLVLFIIGSGYLLIYNVLYISVAKDTRFYGLLKTIGASPTQIKKLVRGQALRFACIGIPVGIALAAAVSFGLIPTVLTSAFLSGATDMEAEVFFHPVIFIASLIFSAVTVWLSCNAPARAASRVSPVEAMRYQNFAPKKAKSRRSRNGGKPAVMAFHNVFRDKKRAVLVFLSLFLGTVTILGVNGLLGSVSAEAYAERYLNYDFEFRHTRFTNMSTNSGEETPQFDQKFIDQVAALGGVQEVIVDRAVWVRLDLDSPAIRSRLRAAYEQEKLAEQGLTFEQFAESLRQYAHAGTFGCYVSTIDERYVQAFNEAHPDRAVDLEAFRRGETALAGFEDETWTVNDALIGQALTLTADGGSAAEFTVAAALKYTDYRQNELIANREFLGSAVPGCLLVSPAGMAKLTDSPVIYDIGVNVSKGADREQLEVAMNRLLQALPGDSVAFESSAQVMRDWNASMHAFTLLGNGASILLIVIGLINFINVMLTSVIARRGELAVLESVGMTRRQIRAMLTWEGGYYALISAGLILTLGNAFLYLIDRSATSFADYAQFVYPTGLVIGLIAAFTVICLSVPAIVYRILSRETVIERLRNFEN